MTKRLKRPRDSLQLAKLIGDIATGQLEDAPPKNPSAVQRGAAGGAKRAHMLSPAQRQEIARKAARTRWGLSSPPEKRRMANLPERGKKEHQ